MLKVLASLAIAGAMLLYAIIEANGVIGDKSFEVGFYGLLAASVVALGSGKCAAQAR